jgi:RimJ/RimL family protein N-acetyltransferase
MKGPPTPRVHTYQAVSECKHGAPIGEPCLSMAGCVWSLLEPRGRCEVCMCRFGTHTLTVSMPSADMEGTRRTLAVQAKLLAIGGSDVQRRARPALVTLPVDWAVKVELPFKPLDGRHVRLEPFVPELKAEVRAAIDCDAETWAIMPVNPMGGGFEKYWSAACGAKLDERLVYAIRRRSDGRVVGMSTYYMTLVRHRGVEIGTTFLHPDVRAGFVNPEAKMLMLDHAFTSGAVRVQFRVDSRNQRSQAAMTKLGAIREGVLRRDLVTWTGYIRDTVVFWILDDEWPTVKLQLEARLAKYS